MMKRTDDRGSFVIVKKSECTLELANNQNAQEPGYNFIGGLEKEIGAGLLKVRTYGVCAANPLVLVRKLEPS